MIDLKDIKTGCSKKLFYLGEFASWEVELFLLSKDIKKKNIFNKHTGTFIWYFEVQKICALHYGSLWKSAFCIVVEKGSFWTFIVVSMLLD